MNGNCPGPDCAKEYKYNTDVPPTINGRLLYKYNIWGQEVAGRLVIEEEGKKKKGGERSRRGTVV